MRNYQYPVWEPKPIDDKALLWGGDEIEKESRCAQYIRLVLGTISSKGEGAKRMLRLVLGTISSKGEGAKRMLIHG